MLYLELLFLLWIILGLRGAEGVLGGLLLLRGLLLALGVSMGDAGEPKGLWGQAV